MVSPQSRAGTAAFTGSASPKTKCPGGKFAKGAPSSGNAKQQKRSNQSKYLSITVRGRVGADFSERTRQDCASLLQRVPTFLEGTQKMVLVLVVRWERKKRKQRGDVKTGLCDMVAPEGEGEGTMTGKQGRGGPPSNHKSCNEVMSTLRAFERLMCNFLFRETCYNETFGSDVFCFPLLPPAVCLPGLRLRPSLLHDRRRHGHTGDVRPPAEAVLGPPACARSCPG